MTGTSVTKRESVRETVDPLTGEIITRAYNATDYLASISTPAAFALQNKLSAAYDAACAALIGPNDIQKAEGRSFKKKSAWRKLARHFGLSVDLVRIEREYVDGVFVATVVARASAPWGQYYEEVGACADDEATGRRSITIADAIATASTRAINRAVSNLIAMGEVSAEEIGDRSASQDAPRREGGPRRMPFGKHRGALLTEMADDALLAAYDWCSETEEKAAKFRDLLADINAEMERRSQSPRPEHV